MAKGYLVSLYAEIHDAGKLKAYAALTGPAFAAYGGRFLARGDAAHAFGTGKIQRTVIVEFPSLEAAYAAYQSAAYQEALAALADGATRDLRIVEGVE